MATGNAVLRAYSRAVKRITDEELLSTAQDAGFIPDPHNPDAWKAKKGKRKGYQVFVKLVKYDEELLEKEPLTGGLVGNL